MFNDLNSNMRLFWFNNDEMDKGFMYKKLEDEFKAEFKHEIKSFDNVNILRLLPAILSRKECNDLLNAYPETTKKNKRNRLVIRILYSTGIRIAELSNLKYCDLNFDDNTIFIRSGHLRWFNHKR